MKELELKLKEREFLLHKKNQAKSLKMLQQMVSSIRQEAQEAEAIADQEQKRSYKAKLAAILLAALKLTLALSGMPAAAGAVDVAESAVETANKIRSLIG